MGKHDYTRRSFLKIAGIATASISCNPSKSMGSSGSLAPESRPNIIFILTDDQRYDAMGCAGHPFLKTPNMDRLAAEGVLFKNAFVTISLCSPSRGCFL